LSQDNQTTTGPEDLGLSEDDISPYTGEAYLERTRTEPITFVAVPREVDAASNELGDRQNWWFNVGKLQIQMRFPVPEEARALSQLESQIRSNTKPVEETFGQKVGSFFCSSAEISSVFNTSCNELNDEMEEQRQLAIIESTNGTVNRAIEYTEDTSKADYNQRAGQTALEGKGDCEDYAIAKYVALRHAGIPASRLYIASVDAEPDATGGGHAVLLYNSPRNNWYVLNNDGRTVPYSSGIEFAGMKAPYTLYNETGAWYNPELLGLKSYTEYVDTPGQAAFPTVADTNSGGTPPKPS